MHSLRKSSALLGTGHNTGVYSETRLLRTLKGNEKRYVLTKVRSIQNAILLTGRTGSTCSRERSATENASPPWMSFITHFHTVKSPFRHRELENMPGSWNRNWKAVEDMLVIRKKRAKERAKKCSWRKNWYVISDFVPRSVRLIRKKCTCFPIGDVRDRRRERYNRVYVLSRVRNNRVSLYIHTRTGHNTGVYIHTRTGHNTGVYIHTRTGHNTGVYIHTRSGHNTAVYIHTRSACILLPWTKKTAT